ncbi:hypothetical protein ACHAWF_010604 [Thalassiosira exigua]
MPRIRRRSIENTRLPENNWTEFGNVDQFHRVERKSNQNQLLFQTRIIGGRIPTSAYQSSFAVSLLDSDGNHFCGGTMLTRDSILTAAHCSNAATGKGPITVVIGRLRLSDESKGEKIRVRTERVHPQYSVQKSTIQWDYDFCIMLLRRPTRMNVRILDLNSDRRVPRAGSLVTAYGWGDTDKNLDVVALSDTLRFANLRTVSNSECDATTGTYGAYAVSYQGRVHANMMCAKNRKRDSCQGDSGGSLVYGNRLVGITSWGVGCNMRGFPGVYARVSSAIKWIQKNVCSMSMLPSARYQCGEPW